MTPGTLPPDVTTVMQVLLDPTQLLTITTAIYASASAVVGVCLALILAVTWKG